MQFLWLILLLGTGPSCVLFLMFSLLHLWVHQMPSFRLKIFFANKPERNPAIRSTSGQLDEPRSLENSWSWFYLLCQLYRADVMSTSCSWRLLPSPMTWGGGAKELVTIFLSARLSSSSQFCSTNVLADDSEVWPWLWHVTCTLETIFSTLKKKKKKCDSLYTVTCQDNNRLRRQFGAGSPLLLQPPLQPARPGEFQWTLSLGCTES